MTSAQRRQERTTRHRLLIRVLILAALVFLFFGDLLHPAQSLRVLVYGILPARICDELKPFPAKPRLTFHQDGTFKLSVFSDVHFGEAENLSWGPEQDRKSVAVMRAMLEFEQPDFVVINGDLITGDDTSRENATDYIDMLLSPLIEAQVPFATTFGNHDNHVNISHSEELKRIQSIAPLAYMKACDSCGGEGGEANFWVPIYPDAESTEPALVLWFFDSRGGKSLGENSTDLPDWVDESVASWLNDTSDIMDASWRHRAERERGIVFSHIPPHRMIDLQQTLNSTAEPGLNDSMGAGSSQSSLGAKGKDLVWWNAMTARVPNIIATVHGHDHGNEWCARDPESQVVLCFNKHTGYGGYDGVGWGHGIRTFELALGSPSTRTYIRLEDGSIHADVLLDKGYDPKPKPKRKATVET